MLGTMRPAGSIGLTIIRNTPKARLDAALATWRPRSDFGLTVAEAIRHLPHELALELLDKMKSVVVVESALGLVVLRNHGLKLLGHDVPVIREDYGIVGRKVVTDLGVAYIVDALQNLVEMETLKFHAIGTGSTAEAVTGAGATMVTELTTEYNPNNTRATGTNSESAANVATSVATNTLDGTPGAALREHGLFDNATVGSGTCFDRTLYAAITLSSGDALQSTYSLTLTSGG